MTSMKSKELPLNLSWRRLLVWSELLPKFDDSNVRNLSSSQHTEQQSQHECHSYPQNDPAYSEVDDATNSQDDEGAGKFGPVTSALVKGS